MIDNAKKISYDNRGSALIMALVVSAVLMVLSLSLLAVSYSFFLSQKNNTSGINEREMFYSAIEAFEQELLSSGHNGIDQLDSTLFDETALDACRDNYQKFGTQIVDSIYNYCMCIDGEYPIDVNQIKPWQDNISRYFSMTSIGAYNIKICLYWEYESNDVDIPSERLKNVLLHACFSMEKKDEVIIQNERTYRIGISYGGIVKTSLGAEVEPTPTPGPYKIEFKKPESGNLGTEFKDYKFYQGYLPDTIYFDSWKDVQDNRDKKVFYNDNHESSEYDWYTTSSCDVLWDGYTKTIQFKNANDKNKAARTHFGYRFPVRIRFVIKDYCIELDPKLFKYTYYTPKSNVSLEEQTQIFSKDTIEEMLSDTLLEMCNVKVNEIDNYKSIIWVQKNNNEYKEFFNAITGEPEIYKPELLKDFTAYYVYATFPSDYKNNNYEFTSDGLNIRAYNANNGKVIDPNNVCQYTKYSLERIVGQ